MRKVFYKKLSSDLTQIELTPNGFSLLEPFGAKPQIFDWKEITDIYFSEDKKEVILQNADKIIVLKNNFMGWYEFIQNVPHHFANFDFQYVITFMSALQPCEICGIIAVNENECLVCENTAWHNEIADPRTEYLKAKQLQLYSELLKEGKEIKQHAEPEHGFQADKNWKLYI